MSCQALTRHRRETCKKLFITKYDDYYLCEQHYSMLRKKGRIVVRDNYGTVHPLCYVDGESTSVADEIDAAIKERLDECT